MSEKQNDWSPFQPTRFEHLDRPVIWLPPYISAMEGNTSVYLPGSRGTGKTTLLKALNYELRKNNDSLRHQLPEGPFSNKQIGLYLRLPDFITSEFYGPRFPSPQPMPALAVENHEFNHAVVHSSYHHAFALLLELQIIQLLTSAIANLSDGDEIQILPKDEQDSVREFLSLYPEIAAFSQGRTEISSFRSLRLVLRSAHCEIQRRSFTTSPEFDLAGLPFAQFGSILQDASTIFLQKATSPIPWRVKVCIDEAECLSHWQQLVLNSLVRLAKTPISYLIAYVRRDFDTVTTLIPHQQLSNADRIVHHALDDLDQSVYRDLLENVVRLYLHNHKSSPDTSIDHFTLKQFLGVKPINELLFRYIKRNQTKESLNLLECAEENAKLPFFQNADETSWSEEPLAVPDETQPTKEWPPLYQTYLIQKLDLKIPDKMTRWKRRQQESAEIRKKMVAAFLSICDEFNWKKIPFAGVNAAFGMSTNCIRDFLDQMHYLYLESGFGRDVAGFVSSGELSLDKQTAGFFAASQNKNSLIPTEAPYSRIQVTNLIQCLGKFLHILQADHDRKETLASPERGLFKIRCSPSNKAEYLNCQNYIQDAIDGGALKIYKFDSEETVFELHRLLAPVYLFSYRKPQYSTNLDVGQLLSCIESLNEDSFNSAFASLIRDAPNRNGFQQTPLPFSDLS